MCLLLLSITKTVSGSHVNYNPTSIACLVMTKVENISAESMECNLHVIYLATMPFCVLALHFIHTLDVDETH